MEGEKVWLGGSVSNGIIMQRALTIGKGRKMKTRHGKEERRERGACRVVVSVVAVDQVDFPHIWIIRRTMCDMIA